MSEPAGTGAVDRVLGAYRGETADGPVAVAGPAPDRTRPPMAGRA